MYRRGDPRWNRTIQNITDTVEHANESAQEGLYSFTHTYVNPCLASVTQCINGCTAPCFTSHNDRRRHRARSRGIAESSFDFYDDWDDDENDGLLGWGTDSLDRLWPGNAATYGTVSQPARQRTMSYGNRNRDPRFTRPRRKSAVPPHDGGPDPTIIPSSSYFGFLGRLPFKIGGKVLRYRPSAADLTEHPGQARRSYEEARQGDEAQPLMEESEDDAQQQANERKGHGRKRSQTSTSGHTTDSLSSRGDIFPSEDELDDAVPLDDEFAVALERRTTGQWHDDASSAKSRAQSSSKSQSKRPAASRLSTRSASSGNTQDSRARTTHDANIRRSASDTIQEIPSLSDLKREEDQVRREEEAEVERKRLEAHRLAIKRGLVPDQHLRVPKQRSRSPSPNVPSPQSPASLSPFMLRAASEPDVDSEAMLSPFPAVDTQTMPDSSSFHVDDSEYSSLAASPNRPLSLKDEPTGDSKAPEDEAQFVPALLPQFAAQQPG